MQRVLPQHYRHVLPLIVFLCALCVPRLLYAQEQEIEADSSVQPTTERVSKADSAANYQELLANLRTIIHSKIYSKAKVGLSIYSLDRKQALFEYNAHEALTPASTTKLFYGFAAMKVLGSDYTVKTQVLYDGTISKDSVLHGNLYLKGHGDCLLTVTDVESLAENVRRKGIKSISGDVVADASFFDDQSDRQRYSGDKERMEALAPISALGINRNIVTVLVSTNSSGVPHVQTIPPSTALHVSIRNAASETPKVKASKAAQTPKPGLTKSSGQVGSKKIPLTRGQAPRTQPTSKRQSTHKPTPKSFHQSSGKSIRKSSHPSVYKSSKPSHSSLRSRNAGAKQNPHTEIVPEFPEYSVPFAVGDMIVYRAKSSHGTKSAKKTSSGKSKKSVKSSASRRSHSTVKAARIRVSSAMQSDGTQDFYLSGTAARNSTQSFSYEMRRPDLVATGVLYRSLQAEGLSISGTVRSGAAPTNAVVLSEVQRPLTDLLSPVNKNSDNFVAEHIMKLVGASCCGNQQCNVNAFKTVSTILDSAHVPLDGCVLYDGSGLSRRNKTSVSTQLNLLRSLSEQPFSGVFYNTMAIAGVDGTLHRRMIGTAAQGNAHAKTGTHANVSALSGYVRTRDGERLCFSMISNGAGVGGFKMLENAVVVQLAEFSYKNGTIAVPKIR